MGRCARRPERDIKFHAIAGLALDAHPKVWHTASRAANGVVARIADCGSPDNGGDRPHRVNLASAMAWTTADLTLPGQFLEGVETGTQLESKRGRS